MHPSHSNKTLRLKWNPDLDFTKLTERKIPTKLKQIKNVKSQQDLLPGLKRMNAIKE
jgi:hypothetical protein